MCALYYILLRIKILGNDYVFLSFVESSYCIHVLSLYCVEYYTKTNKPNQAKKEYSQAFFIINTLVVCCCSLLSLLKNQAISVSIRRPVGNVGEQNIKN